MKPSPASPFLGFIQRWTVTAAGSLCLAVTFNWRNQANEKLEVMWLAVDLTVWYDGLRITSPRNGPSIKLVNPRSLFQPMKLKAQLDRTHIQLTIQLVHHFIGFSFAVASRGWFQSVDLERRTEDYFNRSAARTGFLKIYFYLLPPLEKIQRVKGGQN